MSDVQIAVIDQQDTQIVLAVPGVQGATGSSIPSGGTTDQVLRKNSSTDYDAGWTQVTSAMIANGAIVNEDINNGAGIAGTKISPDFGGQAVTTTGQVSAARVNVTSNTPPSNGIYLPSANNVAISTGGSGKLFVDASGNVTVDYSSASVQSNFRVKTNSAGAVANAYFGIDATDYFRIYVTNGETWLRNPQNTPMAFHTNNTERLRITSTGTVNIVGAGSAGSTQAVSFNGSAPVNSLVLTSGGLLGVGTSTIRGTSLLDARGDISFGSNASYYGLLSYNAGTGHFESTSSDGGFKWIRASGPTTSMTLDSSGRLGIGTSSPSEQLDLGGGASDTVKIRFTMGGNVGSIGSVGSGVANGLGNLTFFTRNGSSEVAAMTIDGSQRVGIGTTSPQEELHIVAASQPYIQVQSTGGVTGSAYYGYNSSTGSASIESTGSIRFAIPGSEAARIDSSGRLLVGTSSWYTIPDGRFGNPLQAGQQIKVSDATGAYGGLAIVSATSTVNERIAEVSLNRQNGATDYAALSDNNPIGSVTFNGADGSNFVRAASIFAYVDGTPGANDMPGRLVFSTTADGGASPVERMRINNAGYTTLVAETGVQVNSTVAAAGKTHRIFEGKYSGTSGIQSSGTTCFVVYTDGDVQNTNNSYGAYSDIKLKENIVNANPQWDDIKALRVRNYNFKEGQTHTQIGLIAQEVELVSPGLVTESPDRDEDGNDLGTVTKSVNYSVLYMKAVKALQEAMERIETLEAKVAALESA